jgi:hypothetical protein
MPFTQLNEHTHISDKTLHRMIEEGDLPDFTYGSKWSKKKGWYAAVLERHAMEKYEQSRSIHNACHASQVRRQDVAVDLLCNADAGMAEQQGNLDNGNPTEQQGGSKVVPKGVGAAPCQSRVAAGFTNIPV